jgi:epoxyqueuosine reductase
MDTTALWQGVLAGAAARGWQARVLPAARLDDVKARLAQIIPQGEFSPSLAAYLGKWNESELPASPTARSVVVGAVARPLTQALLTWRGRERLVQVPPHYAGYRTVPDGLAAAVGTALEPFDFSAARCEPPLKTMAACAGLARYGRNNIAYVDGLGSYLMLAACATDAPPPMGTTWTEPQPLDRCDGCVACRRACPTTAIRADRFLLHTGRCLTLHNEETEPLPEWIEPRWHHVAVGCLRCQLACPVNASVELLVAPPERFDAAETEAILAAEPIGTRTAATQAKLERCGLDYSPELMARNLRLLLEG